MARLNPCLLPIIAYTVLKGDVEQMRKEQYSLENTEHEQLLTKVNGWMDGGVDGWMDKWMDGWMIDRYVIFLSFLVMVSITSWHRIKTSFW